MVDLLMLHRKTKIDVLIDSVPKPPNSVPINALPGWANLPLACKLPMLHCPPNSIIFTRNRLGRKLDNSSALMFRLTESFGRLKYEALHDPNLRQFLYHEENLDFLKKHGQITYYNDVICSLKEFNEYRKYLNQIRLELVNRERERLDAETKDKLLYQMAQEKTEKDFAKKLNSVSQQVKREQIEMDRQQRILFDLQRQDMQCIDRKAEHEKLLAIKQEVRELKEIELRNRKRNVDEAQRLKVAKLKHKLHLRDLHCVKMRKKRLLADAEEKAEDEIQEWFNVLQKRHEHQIRNENLLSRYEANMKVLVNKRIQKITLIREHVQHKILQTKMNLIRSRYENMELQRLIQVVLEEVHRKIMKDKVKYSHLKLNDNTERAGLSPIVAPYRTKAESEYGLGDAPIGYEAISADIIKQVVTTCSQNEKILNGKSYTTMEVLLSSKSIFDRLAIGHTDDLPNDPDVLKFALVLVDSVISRAKERIFRSMVSMVKKENESINEMPNRIKSTSTFNRNQFKSSKVSNIISFKDLDKPNNSKTKSLVLEKTTSLRTMTRSVLETPPLHDDLPIPSELDDDKLFHLSQEQKMLIVRNLHVLEVMLALRLEQNVIARFDLKSLTIKPCHNRDRICSETHDSKLTEEIYNNLIGTAMTSILTKPELDKMFSHNILSLSYYLAVKVLEDLQDYLECPPEEEEEEEEDDTNETEYEDEESEEEK